jgi:enoyl-CoA hydratase
VSDVLIQVERGVGRITLSRPARLNALTLEMVQQIRAALDQWEADSGVEFVLIDGAGERGLCAGGDIRAVY